MSQIQKFLFDGVPVRGVIVRLTDKREFKAKVLGQDDKTDVAVLKIDAQGLTPAEFGDSSSLQVGDDVVSIGNPLGEQLRWTMTNGIISAINFRLDVKKVADPDGGERAVITLDGKYLPTVPF